MTTDSLLHSRSEVMSDPSLDVGSIFSSDLNTYQSEDFLLSELLGNDKVCVNYYTGIYNIKIMISGSYTAVRADRSVQKYWITKTSKACQKGECNLVHGPSVVPCNCI